jgi:hypothetical protein
MTKPPAQKPDSCLPEEYGGALEAVDEAMEAVAGSLDGAAYPVPPLGSRAACATCQVLAVCRLPFAGGEP